MLSSLGRDELIKTVQSPDENYTINFYSWDAGAAGTFGISGEVEGFWSHRRIYYERRIEQAELEWLNNHTISINGHHLDLDNEETFPR
ncbi:hypothetical protein ABID53_000886 [Bacillus oleivorans]